MMENTAPAEHEDFGIATMSMLACQHGNISALYIAKHRIKEELK